MPDNDFSLFDKMRWGYHAVLNQFRTPPSRAEIDAVAASMHASSGGAAPAATGMCLIVFPGTDREDYCYNRMTNDACQNLAKTIGGFGRTVIPGSVCPQ